MALQLSYANYYALQLSYAPAMTSIWHELFRSFKSCSALISDLLTERQKGRQHYQIQMHLFRPGVLALQYKTLQSDLFL